MDITKERNAWEQFVEKPIKDLSSSESGLAKIHSWYAWKERAIRDESESLRAANKRMGEAFSRMEKDISILREVNKKLRDERFALATQLESAQKERDDFKRRLETMWETNQALRQHLRAPEKVGLPVTKSNDTPVPDSLRGDSILSGLAGVIGSIIGQIVGRQPELEKAGPSWCCENGEKLNVKICPDCAGTFPREETDDTDPGMLDVLKSIADFMDKSSTDMAHVMALIVFGDANGAIGALSSIAMETIGAEHKVRCNLAVLESRLVRANDLFDSLESHAKMLQTHKESEANKTGDFILYILAKLRPLCS